MRFAISMAVAACSLALICWPSGAPASSRGTGIKALMAQHIDELKMVSKTDGWAVCEPSATSLRVFITRDGGRDWSNVTPSTFSKHGSQFMFSKGIRAQFTDSTDGYVAVTNKYVVNSLHHGYMEQAAVLATHDGGTTWRMTIVRNAKQNEVPIGLAFVVSGTGWLLTTADNNGGEGPRVVTRLYKTQNGGYSWQFAKEMH